MWWEDQALPILPIYLKVLRLEYDCKDYKVPKDKMRVKS